MNDQHAKIRIEEIRNNLKNAIQAGAIIQAQDTKYGITFKVDEDQNLLVMDDNKVIMMDANESISNIKDYNETIKAYQQFDSQIAKNILQLVNEINDAGLILGLPDSFQFLYEQYNNLIKRTHSNFREWTNIFQCFLDILYWRRYNRVMKYIKENTKKYIEVAIDDINALIHEGQVGLNKIRDKMKICKAVCKTDGNEDECYYLCLLYKDHQTDNDWQHNHC